MTLNEIFDKIKLDEMGREIYCTIDKKCEDAEFEKSINEATEALYIRRVVYSEYITPFAERVNIHENTLTFFICARLLERLYKEYAELGIDDSVFFATMASLPSMCATHYQNTGIYGVRQSLYYWVRKFYMHTLFRLGSLQFEIAKSIVTAQCDGGELVEGGPCIKVHIPRGCDFSDEACEASYAMAREFFPKYFGLPCVFYCGSWLLHPWISECMPSTSKIVQFQKKFKILERMETPEEVGNVAHWIFGKRMDNIDDYPEDTSMQRAAKARMKAGLPMGRARGMRA